MRPSSVVSRFLPASGLLLAATMWGLVWYPLRLLESNGLQGLWTILIAYCAAMVPGAWILFSQRQAIFRDPFLLFCLALAAGWCNAAFIMAVLDGTVVRVLLLFYLSPIWTVILGWFFLGETLSGRALAIFLVAMIGAIFMLWDPQIQSVWPRDNADWLALSSGFMFAVSNVLVRKMQQVTVLLKAAVNWSGVLLVAVLWLVLVAEPQPQVEQDVVLAALGLGLFGFVVMTIAVLYGVSRMPVHRSAVILLFELVVGAVSSLLLANEYVSMREWVGGAFVIAAALISANVNEKRTP